MISFRSGRTELRIYFSFLVFNALLFLLDSRAAAGFYAAAAVHECAHIIAAMLCGQRLLSVELRGTGILMTPEKNAAAPVRYGAAVLMSGPAANIALWGVLTVLPGHERTAAASLMLGLYNLLPYKQLDGGALLSLFTCGSLRERETEAVLFVIRLMIPAALLILAAAVDGSFLVTAAAAVLLFIGDI